MNIFINLNEVKKLFILINVIFLLNLTLSLSLDDNIHSINPHPILSNDNKVDILNHININDYMFDLNTKDRQSKLGNSVCL